MTRAEGPGLWEPREGLPLFFEAKGIAERLLLDLRIEAGFRAGESEPYLHPGASIGIAGAGASIGAVGEIHPSVAAHFEIDVPCAIIEVDLRALSKLPRREIEYRDVSRQPRVRRDIAVLLSSDLAAGEILEAIRKTAGPHLISAQLFDRYGGKGIPAGKVSLAFRLVFQRPDRTLKDAEVAKITDRVVQMLSNRFGGEQR